MTYFPYPGACGTTSSGPPGGLARGGFLRVRVSRFWDSVAAAVAGPQPRHFAQDVFIAGISNGVVNSVVTRDSSDGQERSSACQVGQSQRLPAAHVASARGGAGRQETSHIWGKRAGPTPVARKHGHNFILLCRIWLAPTGGNGKTWFGCSQTTS